MLSLRFALYYSAMRHFMSFSERPAGRAIRLGLLLFCAPVLAQWSGMAPQPKREAGDQAACDTGATAQGMSAADSATVVVPPAPPTAVAPPVETAAPVVQTAGPSEIQGPSALGPPVFMLGSGN